MPNLSKVHLPLHDPHALQVVDASDEEVAITVAKTTGEFSNELHTCGCLALARCELEAGRLGELGKSCPPGVAGLGLNKVELLDSEGL